MKENLMRAPLLKAGAVLLVFALLVYFTSTSADGSVWNSIAMIVIGAIRLVQWVIGMIIGLVVSLAVLFGIFLGAVAMVNTQTAGEMYQALKVRLGEWLVQGVACVADVKGVKGRPALEASTVATAAVADLEKVDEIHAVLESKLDELTAKIHSLETKLSSYASHDKLSAVAEEVTASGDALEKLHQVLEGLEARVEEATSKLEGMSSDKLLGDLPGRVREMEQKDVVSKEDINSVVELVERLQGEIREGIEAAAFPALTDEGQAEEAEHRLFSYFEDPADREKLESLVSETLKKDMTYAQVTNFLVKEMGKEKGEIITDHPSLVKDYVRQRRRAS